ncbi:MAG: RelA/SpoT family protein [Candidatus Peregrinibacteria bacterium]|nr:RelA/SpoT family protein [Candidatus Peregrinibacteria bacterium]MDZ4244820.1 RelA/SpoT family protein [Candidatus Gracilibacteria bacterium]
MNEKTLFTTLNKELKSYLRPFDGKLLKKAYEFAAMAHIDQKRKSGEPYIVHPVSAAIILAKMRVDMPTIITCLLHDVPEDTKYTLDDIGENFGPQVKELVAGITKLSAVYYKNNMQDRQIDTLRRMFLVMAKDIRVALVKLADRLHNMRTLQYVKSEKSLRIAKETMEIYSPLANLLGVWEIRQEMDDLCFKYVYAEEYENIARVVNQNRSKHKTYLMKVKNSAERLLAGAKIKVKVEARWKHFFSIYKKMLRTQKTTPELYDIPAIRLIVNSVGECYETLGVIHSKWKPKPNQFRDYIAVSKPNGYQGLHTTVFGPDGYLVEFQIRTKQMDLEAKYGIASKFICESGATANINAFLGQTPWIKKVLKLQNKGNVEFLEDLKMNVLSDRIFVFSSDGDVFDMPKGASPLDYAYTVSSSLGDKYSFAYVNKERKPISYELQTGDIVEVVTNKKAKPQREWLYFVITDEAKEAIRKTFKKLSKEERLEVGEAILDNVFSILNKGNFRNRSQGEKLKISYFFGYNTVDSFLKDIASGEKSENDLTNALLKNNSVFAAKDRFFLHRLLTFIFSSDRHTTIRLRLKLVLEDRVGLLSDIFDVLACHRININKLVAREKHFSKGAAIDYIDLEVADLSQLHRAMRSLESIDGVVMVETNRAFQYVMFYTTIVICLMAWGLHPFVISHLANKDTNREFDITIFWITTLLLLSFLFYIRKFAQPYAPKAVGRKKFAIFFNFTTLLIFGTLIGEVLSLHLLSLFVFALLMLASLIVGFIWSSK